VARRREAMSTETEPIVAVQLNLPKRVVRQLDTLAELTGKDRNGVIIELVQAARPLTLADVVAPVHEEFQREGMNGGEVDAWAEAEVKAHREGR
jgi:hypothetical protein